ncbi:MAG TPA: tol-pal system protein YbgF [Woeseiaceae bacterium]|nr:tol-pal system protein YbgF [Woeseiaceae bacterium]
MNKHHLLLASVLISGLVSGCTLTGPPEEDPVQTKLNELDRRMSAVERVMQNQSLVDLSQEVQSLQRRTAELQGFSESLEHNAVASAERQRELYNDLDARIQALEARPNDRSANVLDGGTLPPGQLPVPGGSEDDNYRAAFELIKEQRYDQAEVAFKEFLAIYPESTNAPNAQYWLGESYYVRQRFDDALNSFQSVLDDFPGSRKVADALLKIGYCNYELKRWDAAKQALAKVQSDYPDTTAARLAEQRLQRMASEGV